MRHTGLAATLLLLTAVACGNSGRSEEERLLLSKADTLLASGDRQAALDIYESGLGFTDPKNVTTARMGVARIRQMDMEYDTALSHLRKLSVEMSSRPSEAASKAFDAVLLEARSQKRYSELEAEAMALRDKATQNLKSCRAAEVAKVLDWSDHFAITRALLDLSLTEARRPAGETKDLDPLLPRIIASADQRAANCLAKVPMDAKAAVVALDDAIGDVGGTPAATVLVAERMKRKMEMYSKKSSGPSVTGTEGR